MNIWQPIAGLNTSGAAISKSDELGKKEIAKLLITDNAKVFKVRNHSSNERNKNSVLPARIEPTSFRIVPYTGRLSYWRPWDV